MRRARLTIRVRLTLWFSLTLAAVLSTYAGTVSVLVTRRLSDQLDRQVTEDHRAVEDNLELTPDGTVRWRPPTGIVPRADDSERWVDVRDASGGSIYAHAPHGVPPPPLRVARDVHGIVSLPLDAGLRLRAYVGTHRIAGSEVRVLAGRSEAPLREQVQSLLAMLLLGLPLAVAIATAGGYWVARRALAPVDAITEHARRINVDQLKEQLPVGDTDDELGRLAATFNAAFARIARSVEALRSFTAHASHELRTPLAALRAVGEVGLTQAQDAGARREVIESMLEEADRMTRLVEALLALARLEDGRRTLQPSFLELGALARETIAVVTVLAEERGQQIAVDAPAPVYVRGDPTLLRQALLNLLDNAIKYGRDGGRVVVDVRTEGALAQLSVSDDGPGVAPADQARLFERFYRGAGSSAAGFGLGLALARAAIEAQHGSLALTRAGASGSTFSLCVPATEP